MKKILILDTETTGLDPADGAVVIELAGILFDVELRDVIAQCSNPSVVQAALVEFKQKAIAAMKAALKAKIEE